MFAVAFVVIVAEGDHIELWFAYLDEAEAHEGAKEAEKEHPDARISVQAVGLM